MPAKNLKLKTKNVKKSEVVAPKKKVAVKVSKFATKKGVAVTSKEITKAKAVASTKKTEKKESTLTVNVYDLTGKVTGKVALATEIFGDTVNKKLLAQAVRVYLANKRQGNASTKTRGEVDGSTRKIYRQKGTGKARHGSLRAPIFVKGGIVHGPKPRDFSLELPKKMRRKALFSALSAKLADNEIKIMTGFADITPKTKSFVEVLSGLSIDAKKRKMLIVAPDGFDGVKRASRNLQGISSTSAKRLNALDVLRCKDLLFAKESIEEIEKCFLGKV